MFMCMECLKYINLSFSNSNHFQHKVHSNKASRLNPLYRSLKLLIAICFLTGVITFVFRLTGGRPSHKHTVNFFYFLCISELKALLSNLNGSAEYQFNELKSDLSRLKKTCQQKILVTRCDESISNINYCFGNNHYISCKEGNPKRHKCSGNAKRFPCT